MYSENINMPEVAWGHVVVGGAGNGDLCEGFSEAIRDETKAFKPKSMADVEIELKRVLQLFYERDVKYEKPKDRLLALLVGVGLPKAGTSLWRSRGARLLPVKHHAIIGYDAPVYKYFAKRLDKFPGYPSQMVLIVAYLLSIAKETGNGVAGGSQIVILKEEGVFEETQKYADLLTQRIKDFNDNLDRVFFMAMDLAIKEEDFKDVLKQTENILLMLRRKHTNDAAQVILEQTEDPTWKGDLYPKLPKGSMLVRGEEVLYPRYLGTKAQKVTIETGVPKRSISRKSKRQR